MQTPELLLEKFTIFRKLWCVRPDKGRGGAAGRTFCKQGEGSIFSDFVRTSAISLVLHR